jgi:hypothetical protein
MTLTEALQRVGRAIARLHTPLERAIISSNIQKMIRDQSSDLWLSLEEASVCFYPSDEAKANQVFAILKQAKASGQLGDPLIGAGINVGHLDTWPQRPASGDDSPMRYWFDAVRVSAGQDNSDPKVKRQDERLVKFIALGGEVISKYGDLTFKGINLLNSALANEPGSDPKTIRADLKAAYQRAEREAASGAVMTAMGQRATT